MPERAKPIRSFRSTLPHGERLARRRPTRRRLSVSIHAPARGATRAAVASTGEDEFRSTLPHGERLEAHPGLMWPSPSFDPRSRTGSDLPTPGRGLVVNVSIHAPARGATASRRGAAPSFGGFDPRSRTGSDLRRQMGAAAVPLFRSTLPHGERPAVPHLLNNVAGVSIHAPARGATQGNFAPRSKKRFRSTLPHGERPKIAPDCFLGRTFRSTLPHGERRGNGEAMNSAGLFRSTLPHGERPRACRRQSRQ